MRRISAVVSAVLLAACTSPTLETEPAAPSSAQGGGGTGEQRAAGVGDALVLRGNEEGLEMKIVLIEVVDPAKAADPFLAPAKGKRLVGVRLRLVNVGEALYSDSPSNGAALVDRDDHEYAASPFDEVEPGLGSPKIAPGDSREGFITFVLPKGARPRLFQLTLDSGFGPETGQWEL